MGVVAALTPQHEPDLDDDVQDFDLGQGQECDRHRAASLCGKVLCRDHPHHGGGRGARGMPKGLISCMTKVSLQGTQELMKHKYVAVILATGGSDMVRAAHSVGKPAYGVGPGNVPAYVDRSADIQRAAKYIVASKAFDHSVICATEQAVVADRPIAAQLEELMKAEGAYFVDDKIKQILAKNLFVGHLPNPKAVGRSPQQLAQMYGFSVPDWARILVVRLNGVGGKSRSPVKTDHGPGLV